MPAIASNVIVESEAFRANRVAHLELIAQFRALERKVRDASARADDKFRSRGQLPPRERINWLLDRDSAFLELSTLCGLSMHEDDGAQNVYGGGLIAGIGFVAGVRCMVAANDSGIKGGAAHPMGVEKAIRAQEIALREKLPYVQLVESAGANLLLQAEMFVRGGATFANMARMSAAGIPVISIVHGSSTAGGAYQTGLADYVVMVRGRSKVFLAGPPLLKAATGEIAEDQALGGAELHCATTGLGEYLAEDDADALRIGRDILAHLGWGAPPPRPGAPAPLYDPEDLLGIVPVDYRKPYDVREVIARLVDGSEFLDFKPGYGPETVCGHAAIEGREVGLLGNNGPIDSSGASKAGQFIQLCCQAGLPIVFLQNTTGYLVGVDGGDLGHRQARLEDDPGGHQRERPEADAADRRIVWGRPLRHVRPEFRSAVPVFLAERPRRRDGRRAGGEGDDDRRRGCGARKGTSVRRRNHVEASCKDRGWLRPSVDRALRHRAPLGRRPDRPARQPGDSRLLPRDLRGERGARIAPQYVRRREVLR